MLSDRRALPLALALTALAVGCATAEDDDLRTTSGAASTGGGTGTGGDPGTGAGGVATGGLAPTGGDEGLGGEPGIGGRVTTGGVASPTGGRTGTPRPGEEGADCFWPSDCNSGMCLHDHCACGNQVQDGLETGVDCGGECAPCVGSPCDNADPACGGGAVCGVDDTCVPFCLSAWRESTAAASCLAETQPDRADCVRMLDCMAARTCGPAPCETCQEDPTYGAMGRIIANEVYEALCP